MPLFLTASITILTCSGLLKQFKHLHKMLNVDEYE